MKQKPYTVLTMNIHRQVIRTVNCRSLASVRHQMRYFGVENQGEERMGFQDGIREDDLICWRKANDKKITWGNFRQRPDREV